MSRAVRQLVLAVLASLLAGAACEDGGGSRHGRGGSGEGPAETVAEPAEPAEPACPAGELREVDGECRLWLLSRNLREDIEGHTTTLLDDGAVLVVGGARRAGGVTFLGAVAAFEPGSRTWRFLASLSPPRATHTATLLEGGGVLVAGGLTPEGPIGETDRFDPSAGAFRPAAPLAEARASHAAVRLDDGRVLVSGGLGAGGNVLASAELYAPEDDAWTAVAPMGEARRRHTLTLLTDGRVLCVGGRPSHHDDEHAHAPPALDTAELYDPAVDTWVPVGRLDIPRAGQAAMRLGEAGVLVVGGTWDPGEPETIYDATSERWGDVGTLSVGRNDVTLVGADGRVLVVGGFSPGRGPLGAVDVFAPATELLPAGFEALGTLRTARAREGAVVLRDGRLLLVGGLWHGTDGASSLVGLADERLREWGPASPEQAAWPMAGPSGDRPGELERPVAVRSGPDALAVLPAGRLGDRVWQYTLSTGSWSRLPILPAPTEQAALGAWRDDGLVVAGGLGPRGEADFGAAWLLAGSAREWAPLPDLPAPSIASRLVSLPDGGVLLVGGEGGSAEDEASFRLSPGDDTWRTSRGAPRGRDMGVAQLTDGRVAACGGVRSGDRRAECRVYSPATGAWAPLPAMETARSSFTLTALADGSLLAVGGLTSATATTRSVELLQPGADTWRRVESLAEERAEHTATRLPDGRVLVAGGRDKHGPLASWVAWDPVEERWAGGGALENAVAGHAALSLQGAVWIIGGDGVVRVAP